MKDLVALGETNPGVFLGLLDANSPSGVETLKTARVNTVTPGEINPWRFLESLDAANPGDVELLKSTRAHELEVVRNLVLSSKVTLLYAFSGNGKSSLINAGIVPTFQRSGFAVFRTRPRPAFSLANPSQAFKDCLLSEFWLPQRRSDEVLLTKARATLEGLQPEVKETLEAVLSRTVELSKQQGSERDPAFAKYVGQIAPLSLPEFLEGVQRWLGPDVPLLIILDQFEELFVHYYNKPEMEEFTTNLSQIYASKKVCAKFLFSMREDWVGSMVQFRHGIPDVFGSCFKLEPLRVSQALPALIDPAKRFGVTFEQDLPEQILTDLSAFYSVLQKRSFAAVHLTPSGDDDPYIELPALQVLMERLWASSDLSSAVIKRDAYQNLAPAGTKNPAQHVLEKYLGQYLERLSEKDSGPEKIILTELRIDILYLLTDRSAHRRAVGGSSLLSEVNQVRGANTIAGDQGPVEQHTIDAALRPLAELKLVRAVPALGGKWQYELAHDFLVRSVVKAWEALDKKRTQRLAIFRKERENIDEKLANLERLGRAVSWSLRLLPILTFGLTIGLLIYGVTETVPGLLGISYLWVLALPGAVLLTLGLAARRVAPIPLGALVLLCCVVTWFYGYSPPRMTYRYTRTPMQFDKRDWCKQFAVSAASSLEADSVMPYAIEASCNHAQQYGDDENVTHMIYNARGLQGEFELSPRANFCFDVSQVFRRVVLNGENALKRACWQRTPEWSFYLAHVADSERYDYQREYQDGELGSAVGWFAFFLLIGHVLFYPGVLLGAVQNLTASNVLRRVSSEISDVVLILATLVGVEALVLLYWRPYPWTSTRPIVILVVVPLVHLAAYVGVSVAVLARKSFTFGMLPMKLRLTDRLGSSAIPTGRLITRQALQWVWGILNSFFGVPTLVGTPLHLWLRKDHQLLYDALLGLRTEPKHSVKNSDKATAVPLPERLAQQHLKNHNSA
jgi:hypothetical protein